jgi:DNA-directed RNA polymerase subunit M/transcription elongation factor TFIIS
MSFDNTETTVAAQPAFKAYGAVMSKSPRCWIGMHVWHIYQDQTLEAPDSTLVECTRCGKRSSKSSNVAARIGWPGHTGS